MSSSNILGGLILFSSREHPHLLVFQSHDETQENNTFTLPQWTLDQNEEKSWIRSLCEALHQTININPTNVLIMIDPHNKAPILIQDSKTSCFYLVGLLRSAYSLLHPLQFDKRVYTSIQWLSLSQKDNLPNTLLISNAQKYLSSSCINMHLLLDYSVHFDSAIVIK